jgi:putative hydrolase of the HAD superfamily
MHSNHRNLAEVRAVIFDYGEVLCYRPSREEMAQLAGFFRVAPEKFGPFWDRNRGPFDRGDLSADAYWTMLADDAGVKLRAEELKEVCELDMAMFSHINDGMVEWARRLASSGKKIGVLSNMHPDMVAHCRRDFAWLSHFDHLTFSGEVRLIKPEPAIYEHALRGLGVEAGEALFLDDREGNIQAARAMGIHAVHLQSPQQLYDDLRAAGFPILPPE